MKICSYPKYQRIEGHSFCQLVFLTTYRKRWLIDDFRPQVIVIWFSGNRYQALQRSIVAWLCICGCFCTKGQISKQFWQFLCFLKMPKFQNYFMGFGLRFYQRQYSGFHYFHGLNYCDNYLKFKETFFFLYSKMWNLIGMVN